MTTGATTTALRRTARLSLVLLMVMSAGARLNAAQGDAVTRARGLAVAGQRAEAIELLQGSVAVAPGDSDARVLLGTVLSWEGRYDEARRELDVVLADRPAHGDALLASINVELWSDHPARAEELTRRGLLQRPADPNYLLARARALVALQRPQEAADALERLLAIDPRNGPGEVLRRSLRESRRLWWARVNTSYDGFSDRAPWRESQMSLSRTTPIGSIIVRGAHANRFGLDDNQIELEMYPRLRPGTYAYVAGAYSPDALLYPRQRYAADLYQSLGAGFEASVGYRYLGFGSGVNIYVGSLSKYYGNWLFSGRTYITPNALGASRSFHGSFRRYLGDSGTYFGLRYGRGGWREEPRHRSDFEVLDSDVVAADANIVLSGRFELGISTSYSREDRVDRLNLRQYSLSTGLGVRF